jgi:8-amino-7-oxononanoate synthase
MDKFDFLNEILSDLHEKHLLRGLNCIEAAVDGVARFKGCDSGKVLFCSNDYLNIAGDNRVKEAVCDAVGKYGYGACSSRLICGTLQPHRDVEDAFAPLLGCDSALLFNSGWTANEAVLATLPGKGDLVLMDRSDHASIIDAVKASGAKFRTYRRDNLSRLEKYLSDKSYNRKYIVTESVFSMDGDRADLEKLVALKKAYGAILIVDEAHAVGCFGPNGAGLIEELDLTGQIDIIIAPLGKAFGASGGIVAAQKNVIDYLINKARPFIYTTAPPPANCAAIMAGLQIVNTEPERRIILAKNAQHLRAELDKAGFDTGPSLTHIIPVIIGDAKKTMEISVELFNRGYFASAIRPPTVANDSSRLRISLQCNHSTEQIDGLVAALKVISVKHAIQQP